MADTRITDAEIAGHMGWRGPGAYTEASLRKIRGIVDHVLRAERAAASEMQEKDLRDVFNLAWNQALSDAAFYADSHCAVDEHHLEHMLELVPPKLRVRGVEIASRPDGVDEAWVLLFEALPHVPPQAVNWAMARVGPIEDAYIGTRIRKYLERVAAPSHTTNKEK